MATPTDGVMEGFRVDELHLLSVPTELKLNISASTLRISGYGENRKLLEERDGGKTIEFDWRVKVDGLDKVLVTTHRFCVRITLTAEMVELQKTTTKFFDTSVDKGNPVADFGFMKMKAIVMQMLTELKPPKGKKGTRRLDVHIALLALPWQEALDHSAEGVSHHLINVQDSEKKKAKELTLFEILFCASFGKKARCPSMASAAAAAAAEESAEPSTGSEASSSSSDYADINCNEEAPMSCQLQLFAPEGGDPLLYFMIRCELHAGNPRRCAVKAVCPASVHSISTSQVCSSQSLFGGDPCIRHSSDAQVQ